MELQPRQFEQLQRIFGTTTLPVLLLKKIEVFNEYSRRAGGGYLNGSDLGLVCMMWEFNKEPSPMVETFMEYRHYEEPKPEKQPVARKKKVPVNG